jgi:hypothetical protein
LPAVWCRAARDVARDRRGAVVEDGTRTLDTEAGGRLSAFIDMSQPLYCRQDVPEGIL